MNYFLWVRFVRQISHDQLTIIRRIPLIDKKWVINADFLMHRALNFSVKSVLISLISCLLSLKPMQLVLLHMQDFVGIEEGSAIAHLGKYHR